MSKSLLPNSLQALLHLFPPRIITMYVYIATIPLTLIVTVFAIPSEINRPIEYWYWTLIGLLGHLTMLPFVLYGLKIKKIQIQIPLLLAMGLVRGVTIGVLQPIFGFKDEMIIPVRALISMLIIFYMFYAFSVVYNFRNEFKRKVYGMLKQSAVKNQRLEMDSLRLINDELVTQILDLQTRLRYDISNHPSSNTFKRGAKSIDKLVSNYVRPLSKSSWQDEILSLRKLGIFHLLKRSLKVAPLPIFEVYLLTLPLSLTYQIYRYEFWNMVIAQLVWLCSILVILKAGRSPATVKNNGYLIKNISIILLASVIIAPIIYLIDNFNSTDLLSFEDSIYSHILTSLVIAGILAVSSFLVAVNSDQSLIIAFFENEISDEDSKNYFEANLQRLKSKEYAQYLHTEVQSKLLGCKLLLLKAAESNFEKFSPEITNQIMSTLDGLGSESISLVPANPSRRIEKLASSWVGIADVSFDLPANLDEFGEDANMVCQLIEEGVINAIRHGKAKKIKIHGFFIPGSINVVIHDDGTYVKNKKSDGLGSVLFNTFAKDWDIRPEQDGTTLRFSVETFSNTVDK